MIIYHSSFNFYVKIESLCTISMLKLESIFKLCFSSIPIILWAHNAVYNPPDFTGVHPARIIIASLCLFLIIFVFKHIAFGDWSLAFMFVVVLPIILPSVAFYGIAEIIVNKLKK
jgi:hypothetical protein